MSPPRTPDSEQPSLFDRLQDTGDTTEDDPDESGPYRWPTPDRFPLNEGGETVGAVLETAYRASDSFTIVTGYTSLEHLLSFFSRHEIEGRSVDIILGNEPTRSANLYVDSQPIPERARTYWLERGVSILTGGGAVRMVEAIEEGHLRFFSLDNLHAKIYVGDTAAILGSSNFSRFGLEVQREANVRFTPSIRRYEQVRSIADGFREDARECSAKIRALIEDLLQPVGWQEALARAAAEILEGKWAKRYPEVFRQLRRQPLWPHQEQAVAQGLWILDTRGSVLVADATGSGKTRVGTHLLYGLLNRLWSTGQQPRTEATVICPPNVTENWSLEIQESPGLSVEAISHGKLSHGNERDRVHRRVHQSHICFIDEAHNFLNENSGRSKAIEVAAPDYTGLLTATPINRGAQDLLRMIELLGLDNLADAEFETYKELRRKADLSTADEEKLRSIVRQCTIRRTKQDLNGWVDRQTEGYTTAAGVVHRFPKHICEHYPTCETNADKALAAEIGEMADRLKGLFWLQTFNVPWEKPNPEKERKYLDREIRKASGLISHQVRTALQSSKAALLELAFGTEAAAERVGLAEGLKEKSGNFVERVPEICENPPAENHNLHISLPEWLTVGLEETVEEEVRLLRRIGEKAAQLSDARRAARGEHIATLTKNENVVLAFTAKPITLYHLQDYLRQDDLSAEILVCDGSMSQGQRRAAIRRLGLEGVPGTGPEDETSEEQGLIALCSDAMSEGINLQRAASVVLLDTPSVIRIAEQRVGRIDRMNSPHESITVWWPDDSPPFQSQKRDLLIERHSVNGRLMGNNIKLPERLNGRGNKSLFADDETSPIATDQMIDEYEKRQSAGPEERLEDAFQPVRRLVGLEESTAPPLPLIERSVYEPFARETAAVWSRITVRSAQDRWGFFCLRGQERRAPRWVLLRRGTSDATTTLGLDAVAWSVETRLSRIADALPSLIRGTREVEGQRTPRFWKTIEPELTEMTNELQSQERELLSNRARHALWLLRKAVYRYELDAEAGSERERVCTFLKDVTSKNQEPSVNLHDLTDAWLGVVQPRYVAWKRDRKQRIGRDPVRLKDMKDHLVQQPIETEALRQVAEAARPEQPIRRRIVAAIVAFPLERNPG